MNQLEWLRGLRDGIADMIEDPQSGYGLPVSDRGLDVMLGVADLAFTMNGRRFQVEIKEIAGD